MLGSLPICYLSVKDQDATGQHISGTESGRGAPSRAALEGEQQGVVGLSLQRQLAGQSTHCSHFIFLGETKNVQRE